MATTVLRVKHFNPDKINYSEVKILKDAKGAKNVYLTYGDQGGKIILQTPTLYLPFNMSVFDNNNTKKYSIGVSFRGMEERPELQAFYDKLTELDTKFIRDGMRHSVAWLKKPKLTREVATELYSSTIKLPINKETGAVDDRFPPTIRLKLPYWNDKFQFEVFDFNQNKINLEERPLDTLLVKGTKVCALVQCSVLWSAAGKFGASWRVVQLRVKPQERLVDYAFLEDSDDEPDGVLPTNTPTTSGASASATASASQGVMIEDSDEDSDDNDSDAPPAPVTITKPKKKRTKKTKGR